MQMTYNPGKEMQQMTKDEAQLAVEANTQMERLRNVSKNLKQKEKTLAGIKLATVAIHSKLIYVKPSPVSLVLKPCKCSMHGSLIEYFTNTLVCTLCASVIYVNVRLQFFFS